MPRLDINVPFETDQPVITVDIDPAQPLRRGRHEFQLEVMDDAGNVSAPARLVVLVLDEERPNAVLTGPDKVPLGKPFDLDGSRSVDIGGVIKTWRFTYLGPRID